MKSYKIRDLPLSFDDACILEEAREKGSIRLMRPLLERYLILDDGKTLADVPLSDLGAIIDGIINRHGAEPKALKT